ncbi:MmgE/PrpD family protein [Actinomadura coerulea]|uniref:MmgE/PrpD family protein n=1 Tax=Actinomadura coerulea TaxID=46159 RepID=UPI003438E55B
MSTTVHSIDDAVTAAAGLDLARVPESAVRHAQRVIADTVAAAGATTPEIAALVALDERNGLVTPVGKTGPGHTATVLPAPGRRTYPEHAAFLNATAGTALELDEGMRPTGHPAVQVVPAALAVAEHLHAPGADLLRSVIAGYEVSSRLFRAVRLRPGVHPHGHLGALGAAVAVALLDGTDPLAAARIAATGPVLATWQPCYEGATARNAFTGHAAASGVRATAMARAGYRGSAGALEDAFGRVAGEIVDGPELSGPLDYGRLGITRNYFKVHSACALTHCAIEAALAIGTVPVDAIREVRVDTVTINLKIGRRPAANDLSGRFSLPYAVATALLVGGSGVDAFRYRPDVAELARKVTVRADTGFDARWPEAAPARVTVRTDDGALTAVVDNPRGHHTRPLSAEEHRDKFVALLGDSPTSRAWWDRLTELTAVTDCAELFA